MAPKFGTQMAALEPNVRLQENAGAKQQPEGTSVEWLSPWCVAGTNEQPWKESLCTLLSFLLLLQLLSFFCSHRLHSSPAFVFSSRRHAPLEGTIDTFPHTSATRLFQISIFQNFPKFLYFNIFISNFFSNFCKFFLKIFFKFFFKFFF